MSHVVRTSQAARVRDASGGAGAVTWDGGSSYETGSTLYSVTEKGTRLHEI